MKITDVRCIINLKKILPMFDQLLFVALPYLALFLCVIVSIVRLKWLGYTITSHSSQFLETRWLYWGSRFFHFGIIAVVSGHLLSLVFPDFVIWMTSSPFGLKLTQSFSFAAGILAMAGITILIIRRSIHQRLFRVTNAADVMVYIILGLQIITGLLTAYYNRWGTVWYSASLVPYLRSLLTFTPDTSLVTEMPILIKTHMVLAYLFVSIIPFSRLIHFFAYPLNYFFRPYQVVIWYQNLKAMRKSTAMRSGKKPVNN